MLKIPLLFLFHLPVTWSSQSFAPFFLFFYPNNCFFFAKNVSKLNSKFKRLKKDCSFNRDIWKYVVTLLL